jgi:hypothetical protein
MHVLTPLLPVKVHNIPHPNPRAGPQEHYHSVMGAGPALADVSSPSPMQVVTQSRAMYNSR